MLDFLLQDLNDSQEAWVARYRQELIDYDEGFRLRKMTALRTRDEGPTGPTAGGFDPIALGI